MKFSIFRLKKDKTQQSVPYNRLFSFSTSLDKLYLITAAICTIMCGATLPYALIIFGDLTESMVSYAMDVNNALNVTQKNTLDEKFWADVKIFAIKSVLMAIATIIGTYVSTVLLSYSAANQIFRMRQKFLEKMLNQDIQWFDIHQIGDFTTTFTQNISKIEEGIGENIGLFLFFESMFVFGIIMALIQGWKLTLVCMVSMPLSTIIMCFIAWISNTFSQEELESYGACGAIAEEVLGAIRTVVAFEGREKEMTRYNRHLVKAKNNNITRGFFRSLSNGITWFFVYACYALSFWYGVGLVIKENSNNTPLEERTYTPGNMVGVFFCTLMATWNFSMGAPFIEVFATASGAAQKIFLILDSEPIINKSKESGTEPIRFSSMITFDNVYFKYPSRTEVQILRGFSLKINYGQRVALVGPSGCGKSTCIQLLQRFYDPVSGNIFIDENNLKDINLRCFREKIAVVGQEPTLFATTIAENIRYGKLTATREEIVVAAKKSTSHKFIMRLPYGYDTLIGERGSQLSGGQKQRIAIARALVKKPEILLLDESTSALDVTSEAEVQSALDAIRGECATIIVAHRLSTIRNADVIVFISEGRVIEKGSHAELMQAQGAYYKMVSSQGITETNVYKGECWESEAGGLDEKSNDDLAQVIEKGIAEEKKKCGGVLLKLIKMNGPEWFPIFVGCISSIISGASLPIYGLIFGGIVGVFAYDSDKHLRYEINVYCFYFLLLGVGTGITMFLQMFCFSYTGEKLTLRIRQKTFEAILRQEIGWYDRKENGVGALCSQLAGDSANVQGAAGIQIGASLNFISTFILTCTFSLYYEWRLSLLLLSFSPLLLFSSYFEGKALHSDAEKRQRVLDKSANIAVEAIGNIRTVVSLGCENVFLTQYVDELLPYQKSAKRKSHYRGIVLGLARSLILFVYASGIAYGTKLIVDGKVNYSTVLTVSEVITVGCWSIGNALSLSPNLKKGLIAAERIFTLIERVTAIRNVDHPISKKWENEDVDYSEVHFSYPTRPSLSILNGLNLAIQKGTTVALVGSSGCGKSTVIQLFERFYDPTYGKVSMDGKDIKQIDLKSLRSRLGIVSQEPNLFDRTIAENIAYGANHRKVTMDEIIEAAKSANIHSFISSLPQGYDTHIGCRGTQLSGGQKQRIAIARALVGDPKILLLDEPTSALDNENEKIVQQALYTAMKNRTCIMVAHRLTTIQDADVICVLNDGFVAEMGNHWELLEKRGIYYNFYRLQSGCN